MEWCRRWPGALCGAAAVAGHGLSGLSNSFLDAEPEVLQYLLLAVVAVTFLHRSLRHYAAGFVDFDAAEDGSGDGSMTAAEGGSGGGGGGGGGGGRGSGDSGRGPKWNVCLALGVAIMARGVPSALTVVGELEKAGGGGGGGGGGPTLTDTMMTG
eukprot:SAG22_NODE_10992_length_506_cov_0.879607_1_plen_154_part_01